MGRKYYTLLSKGNEVHHNGEWVIEFGDYDRETVEAERDEQRDAAKARQERVSFKIITTGDKQADINAAVAKLNEAL